MSEIKLCNREPTPEMIKAAEIMASRHNNGSSWITKFWQCMFDASPSPRGEAKHVFEIPVTRYDWTRDGMEAIPKNQAGPDEYVKYDDYEKLYNSDPAPCVVAGEDVRKVVEDHVADLLRCAAILEEQTGWNKTAAEIRLAANELTAAIGRGDEA